jgi:hypothetical protein
MNSLEIKNLIDEGEHYMSRLDETVKKTYRGNESEPLLFCRTALQEMGLPPFLAALTVERAFRSHLNSQG